jgi:hypothetical protein
MVRVGRSSSLWQVVATADPVVALPRSLPPHDGALRCRGAHQPCAPLPMALGIDGSRVIEIVADLPDSDADHAGQNAGAESNWRRPGTERRSARRGCRARHGLAPARRPGLAFDPWRPRPNGLPAEANGPSSASGNTTGGTVLLFGPLDRASDEKVVPARFPTR